MMYFTTRTASSRPLILSNCVFRLCAIVSLAFSQMEDNDSVSEADRFNEELRYALVQVALCTFPTRHLHPQTGVGNL